MRRPAIWTTLLILAWGAASAGSVSRSYVFRAGTTLEIGADTGDGVRIDTVRFALPREREDGNPRVGGVPTVDVAVSNAADARKRVGLAVALFDDAGNLIGVASAGSTMSGVKPGRQQRFTLVFDHVNGQVHAATRFQVTAETR